MAFKMKQGGSPIAKHSYDSATPMKFFGAKGRARRQERRAARVEEMNAAGGGGMSGVGMMLNPAAGLAQKFGFGQNTGLGRLLNPLGGLFGGRGGGLFGGRGRGNR
tara:strand:+ start:75 stop:392 length:318 start_codon:yes stop_codon:yes gene_type:complete